MVGVSAATVFEGRALSKTYHMGDIDMHAPARRQLGGVRGDGGRARLRTIELGQRNNESAEVVGGLRETERVVLHPPNSSVDGDRIRERQ